MSTEPKKATWGSLLKGRQANDTTYTPSDPPTLEDWEYLKGRADRNKRRSRLGLLAALLAVVMAIVLGAGGLAVYVSQKDVPKLVTKTNHLLSEQKSGRQKQNEILAKLEQSDEQRQATSQGQALALAEIVEGVAAGFATPPYPDPDRQRAVELLCQTARQFRTASGSPPASDPPCNGS